MHKLAHAMFINMTCVVETVCVCVTHKEQVSVCVIVQTYATIGPIKDITVYII